MTLAATARSFEDIPELDFRRPDQDSDEIDIAALADGQLTIGEAKCVASLGTRREANQAISKLIRSSDLLGADEILLATTAPGPWNKRETDQLLKAAAGHRWRFGKLPGVRVPRDLRDDPKNELLATT